MSKDSLYEIYLDSNKLEITTYPEEKKYLFKKKYINAEGIEAIASLFLFVGDKVRIEPGRTERKDLTTDTLPLWSCIAELIQTAVDFKKQLDNGIL